VQQAVSVYEQPKPAKAEEDREKRGGLRFLVAGRSGEI
jgi:hypothetical protein